MNNTKLVFVLLSLALIAGCGTPQSSETKSSSALKVAVTQASLHAQKAAAQDAIDKAVLVKANPRLPAGVVDIADLTSSLYEYLVGYWISNGSDEDEIFERAGRIYRDIRQDYYMRVSSGLTPQSAKAALMPQIVERIKSSALPNELRLGQLIQPRMWGSRSQGRDSYNEKSQTLVVKAHGTGMVMPSSSKYRAVTEGPNKSNLEEWSEFISSGNEKFNKKPLIGSGYIELPLQEQMTFPLTAEAMYRLKKEATTKGKPLEELISVGSDGGYILLGKPVCKETTARAGSLSAVLVCTFGAVSSLISPLRAVSKTNPLATFDSKGFSK